MSTVQELLHARWSPKAFAERDIARDDLHALFEAARWAPSCYNDQPWEFVVTRRAGGSGYAAVLDCLVEGNRAWAATAPVLMVGFARLQFRERDRANAHALYDLGQAVGQLLVRATELGIYAHQMAGFDRERAAEVLGAPAGYEAVVAAALGYLGDPGRLPDGVTEKDPATRERVAVDEFVWSENWGQALKSAR